MVSDEPIPPRRRIGEKALRKDRSWGLIVGVRAVHARLSCENPFCG